MSAPETTSKGRPSLLSETAPGAPDNTARILASLEGRVAAQQAPRFPRIKKHFVAAALAVVGVGVVGAWQWQRAQDHGYPVTGVVGGSVAGVANAGASSANGASGPAGASARVAQNGQGAASTPQAAVIVADEAPASAPSVAGTDPLSRALSNGAVPPTAKSASAVGSAGASGGALASAQPAAAGKPADARTEHDSAKRRHAEKLAAARAGRQAKGSAAQGDSDADLLSVLVARTKPYDSHAAKKGKGASGKERTVSLAARVKECEKSNFFEAQVCRWHVCSDHWGKDPACPSPNTAEQTR